MKIREDRELGYDAHQMAHHRHGGITGIKTLHGDELWGRHIIGKYRWI